MFNTTGSEIAPFVQGAVRLIETGDSVRPVRISSAAETSIPSGLVREILYNTTGVRLRMTTDATRLELDCAFAKIGYEITGPNPMPQACELTIDGSIWASADVTSWQDIIYRHPLNDHRLFSAGERVVDTIVFDSLPPGSKNIELWLPSFVSADLVELRSNAQVDQWPDNRATWVHYGSSISHGALGANPTDAWPVVAARMAGVNGINLGVAGECHLDQFVARTIRDMTADFISIKAGINVLNVDSFKSRTFGPAIHGFLDTIRDGHPTTPIVLASPTYCAMVEEYPGPFIITGTGPTTVDTVSEVKYGALTQRYMREIVSEVVRVREDPNLTYLNGLDLMGESDADLLVDGLHPGIDGARLMGKRFADWAFAVEGPFGRSARVLGAQLS